MEVNLVVVRHGETDGNKQKLLQGHVDTPLNDAGLEQARRAGLALAHHDFRAVYTSDLSRAVQTAGAILGENTAWKSVKESEQEAAWKKMPVLRERCFGVFEGLAWDAFKAESIRAQKEQGVDEKHISVWGHTPDGGESIDEVVRRAEQAFKEVCADMQATLPASDSASSNAEAPAVLLVSHGGFIKQLMHHFASGHNCKMPRASSALTFKDITPNTGISRFQVRLDKGGLARSVTCSSLHDAQHLEETITKNYQ